MIMAPTLPGQDSRVFVLPSTAHAKEEAITAATTAVGLAIFGDVSQEEIGEIALSVLGSSWLGDFAVNNDLTRHLFVPSNQWARGRQPVCNMYINTDTARALPLFRLASVLYPSCSMIVKIFEPRYLRMIKRCIEKNEPFGVIHPASSTGTLCYVSEIYQMDETSGVSTLKVTGIRRFNCDSVHVPSGG